MLIPPNEAVANLLYRKSVRAWAVQSKANRKWLWDACAKDFLFFLRTFSFVLEPRPVRGQSTILPFNPWPTQLDFIRVLETNAGYSDILVKKSRGEGATLTVINYIVWRWMFSTEPQLIGIVSRNENAADSPEDPDSLGAKIDFLLSMLPKWMTGEKGKHWTRIIAKHTWTNHRNQASIVAYPAIGDLAAGGRKSFIFMDELGRFPRHADEEALSATEPATNSRIIVSTYAGASGAYYRCMQEDSEAIRVTMDWQRNPTRNKDLFTIDTKAKLLRNPITKEPVLEGEFTEKFFEDNYHVLAKRGFEVQLPNKVWSPWYVSRCLRPRMTRRKVAQEYDMDAGGSGDLFFPMGVIEDLCSKTIAPRVICNIEVDEEKLIVRQIVKMLSGHLKLWISLVNNKNPPRGLYVIGCDVASGQGGVMSSNSVASIVNRETGVKVGEFASAVTSPEKFAEISVALCRWFKSSTGHPAYLIFESNGYGGAFRDRVIDSKFNYFHWRTPRGRVGGKRTKEAGFYTTKDSKKDLLSRYRWSITEGWFDNCSEAALRECGCYAYGPGDRIIFVSPDLSDIKNEAASGEAHGDRVIADALSNFGCEELNGGSAYIRKKQDEEKPSARNPPPGSFMHRRKRANKLRKKSAPSNAWNSFAKNDSKSHNSSRGSLL